MAKAKTSATEQLSHTYWSGRAEEYSALHMEQFRSEKAERFRACVREAVAAAPCGGDDGRIRALDLGCGSGFLSLFLLEAGCKVVGIDFSAEMGAQAKANVEACGFDAGDFAFLQMRAQRLEFPDGCFDVVVSRNVTWTLEDVDAVYAEVFRVLAPGGVFLNMDANYGRQFREAEERGEALSHPTQSLEQLQMRNDVVRDLAISKIDRPGWDVNEFWNLGASHVAVRCIGAREAVGTTLGMFALVVTK